MLSSDQSRSASVLLVDDEPNVLRSLQRLLRQDNYSITLAESGDKALELLHESAFDIVLSDARMPGMDGATLLGHAHQLHPDSVRILLTGYADITTTVKAVNEGRIYRYMSKPWDDHELRGTLQQGLAMQHSERERLRLSHIVAQQNQKLKQLNLQLQGQVTARTCELEQTADMLELTYDELKQSYMQATEVFGSLINLRLPRIQQTNARVVELSKAMAELLDYPDSDVRNLSMAAALYNIGKLTWDDQLLSLPRDNMASKDQKLWAKYPQISSQILLGLEPMQDASRIIRHLQESWDGKGHPDQLVGKTIPQASQILRMAVDFTELQHGLQLSKKLKCHEALEHMQRFNGRHYSPDLFPLFVTCTTQVAENQHMSQEFAWLTTRQLLPGMVLASNLHAHSGLLLLNADKPLTGPIIDKLISFEATEQTAYRIPVSKASLPKTRIHSEENPL